MRLLVATPVRAAELYAAHVSLGYATFREQLARLMPDYKSSMVATLDVVRARNRMVGLLLSHADFAAVTHVLWVDDDQWPDDVRIVPAMVAACRGVLGAPYTNKRNPLRWVHRGDGEGGFSGIGFGFTMTTRACLERLAERARWYIDLPHGLRCPDLFGQLYETERTADGEEFETLLSEDYSFCKRAREAGYVIDLYPAAGIVNHAGGHVWNARQMPGGVVG